MSNELYNSFKPAWHIDRIASLRAGKLTAPVGIHLILSDRCNESCQWCSYRSEIGLSQANFVEWKDGVRNHNPNRTIATDKAKEILGDAAAIGVRSVMFTGGGEPTVHPDHLELFTNALDLSLDCSLNSNGLVLRNGFERVLPRFVYVRFSVDAGNAETYSRTRGVGRAAYDRVLTNISKVVETIREQRSPCVVGTGYVVSPDTWQSLVEGVRRFRDLGVAYVRIASIQSTIGMKVYDGIESQVHDVIANAKELATDTFKVVDQFDRMMGNIVVDPYCGFQRFVLYIGGNLKAFRCCYTAYTDKGEVGDLSNQSLKEWFESEQRRIAYDNFDARSCGNCPLADQNATIAYMINPSPPHVNFV